MNWASIAIGMACVFFGLYSFYARKNHPEKLKKLQAMKSKWGEGKGNIIHLIGYSILPIVAGFSFIICEMIRQLLNAP